MITTILLMIPFTNLEGEPITSFQSCGVTLSSFPQMNLLQEQMEAELKQKGYTLVKPSFFQKIMAFFNKKYRVESATVSVTAMVDGKSWQTEKMHGGELWALVTVKNIKSGKIVEFEDSVMNTTDYSSVMPQLVYRLTPKTIKAIEELK